MHHTIRTGAELSYIEVNGFLEARAASANLLMPT
jgi:hypothetical protein